MNINKIHFVIDKTNKALIFKKTLLKKYKNFPAHRSDVIVVIGGDGFMLKTLKKLITTKALVVKLVDTKDLKSLPVRECQFESGRGHHCINYD